MLAVFPSILLFTMLSWDDLLYINDASTTEQFIDNDDDFHSRCAKLVTINSPAHDLTPAGTITFLKDKYYLLVHW